MIELPTLYSKDAKGKIRQWRVWSDGDRVVMEYGLVDGKKTKTSTPCKPTNEGRANERDAEAQAEFEAQSNWSHKKDQGFFETIEEAKVAEVLLPMLAKPLSKKKKKALETGTAFPCSAQRKLNGVRCLAFVNHDGTVSLVSRGGKEWSIPHIEAAVQIMGHRGDVFDGEIYIHGMPLQDINSLVKNPAKPERIALEYHIYDMPKAEGQGDGVWTERYAELCKRYHTYEALPAGVASNPCCEISLNPNPIQLVETRLIRSYEELKAFEREAVAGFYEGLIVRLHEGLHGAKYTWGLQRSDELIKWKQFEDAEFTVVDASSRLYSLNDVERTIVDVFVCKNNLTDDTFEVVPKGSIEKKVEFWENRDYYIGQQLVVRFLERSKDGIPQGNPVGIAFRLEEDGDPDEEGGFWS